MISNEIKEELINGLREILSDNLECIILYGSVARGDSTPDSDIDIALIVRTSLNDDVKDSFLHWNALMDIRYEKVFSIVDIEKEILDKWGAVNPFYKKIQDEGVVLWKAA